MRKTKDLTDEEFRAMTPQEQFQELKRLKKALELEKIRSEAYNHMIELAEQQFNIPIRKKIWHQTVSWLRSIYLYFGLGKCCALFGYSR